MPSLLADPTGLAFDCGEMPCEGPGARSPFWQANEINYAKIAQLGNSQLLQDCEDNPGLCGGFLRWNGYEPDEFRLITGDYADSGVGTGTDLIRISPSTGGAVEPSAPGPATETTTPTITDTNPASLADTVEQNAGRGIKVIQVGSYPGYDTPWVTNENYITQNEFQEKLSLPPHNTARWFREMIVSENGLTDPQVVEPQYGHLGGGIEMRIIDPNAIIYAGPWIPTIALVLALSM